MALKPGLWKFYRTKPRSGVRRHVLRNFFRNPVPLVALTGANSLKS